MSKHMTRPLAAALLAVFAASVAVGVPVPPKKPTAAKPVDLPLPGTPLKFLKLEGVNPKTGAFNKPTKMMVTEYVTVNKTVAYVVNVNGKQQQRTRTVTERIPVTKTVVRQIGTETHDVYDGNGDRIPAGKVFDRIKDGQLVIVSATPTLPKEYLKLLSAEAIIIAPKREAPAKEE